MFKWLKKTQYGICDQPKTEYIIIDFLSAKVINNTHRIQTLKYQENC